MKNKEHKKYKYILQKFVNDYWKKKIFYWKPIFAKKKLKNAKKNLIND